jgi:hypothetical protein
VVSESPRAQAQSEPVPPDGLLRASSPDGQPLALMLGPSYDQPVVVWVQHDEPLTVVGNPLTVGTTRWMPVRTTGNQVGWIVDQYVVAAILPTPLPQPSPELALGGPPPPPAAPPPEPLTASIPLAPPAPTVESRPERGRPLEIEAKVKYPEAKGRHQEVTIWVTRDGAPIQGATVTIFTEDDEDEPLRVLELTNSEGRTRREFAIGKEKGSIELVVSATAPDGGSGRTTVTYFRR